MQAEHLELIIGLRHHLHKYPELSLKEYKTKEILMGFLKTHTKLEVTDRGQYVGNGELFPELHTLSYDFNDSILETVVEMYKELVKLWRSEVN